MAAADFEGVVAEPMARQGKASGSESGSKTKKASKALTTGSAPVDEAEAEPVKPRTSITDFVAQVRQEGSKVTWPTRQETTVTTIMVFIMVVIAAIFFMIVDWLVSLIMGLILGMGG